MKLSVRGERKAQRYFLCTNKVRHELRICDLNYVLGTPSVEEQRRRLFEIAKDVEFLQCIGYTNQQEAVWAN